jgi:ABC-type uncharacterized transport system permease subunit
MKVPAIKSGILVTVLLGLLLCALWRYLAPSVLPAPQEDHWASGIIIWPVSLGVGIWYASRLAKRRRN